MPTVYVETTIPSYYFETRRTAEAVAWREATRKWWRVARSDYELVTSRLVLEELGHAPAHKADPGRKLLEGVQVLDELPELLGLAQHFVAQRLMPESAKADSIHLAHTCLHGIDFLLTWNCKHLANANKTRHLAVLTGRLGVRPPVLATPLTLMPED